MGDISNHFLEQLHQNVNDFQSKTKTMQISYDHSLKLYSNLMRNKLNKTESYSTQSSLVELHQYSKREAITQVFILSLCIYLK